MADEKDSAAQKALERAEDALTATAEKAKQVGAAVRDKVSDLVPDAIENQVANVTKHAGSLFSDFFAFINRGSVLDLAIGVIIGGNFTAIVNATIEDLLSPVIAFFSPSGSTLGNRIKVLRPGKSGKTTYETLELAKADGAIALAYGHWLQVVLNFFSVAPVLFLIVKAFTASQQRFLAAKAEEAAAVAPTTKACPGCLEDVKVGAKRCKFCGGDV
ncbi:large-conductance mechanosensitive channel [Hyaloraphidium curvatum]|nr:large-conductance mechanosensitive channel [Hyaloraphidium curvatum]